jgi:site-specific recombinase XerD
MANVCRAKVPGPLAAHADGFRAELARLGYTPGSAEMQVLLMARVSRWLEGEGLGASDLSSARVERMVAAWRSAAAPGVRVPTARSLVALVVHLRSEGVLAPEPEAARSALDDLLADYRGHLARDRGLAARTIDRYEGTARRFLEGRRAVGVGPTGAEVLTGGEVVSFLLGECSRLSVGSAKSRVADLRSLLRFLHLRGVTESRLAESVPPVAGWRDARLIATLSAGEVAAILGSCDTSTGTGARDLAVLLVLARLGLRAAEVAGLMLDDVDWRAGELSVHGKGSQVDRLPLPDEVGEAIASYLTRWRPRAADCRAVFLTRHAPWRQMHVNTISRIVRVACKRAGVTPVSAHRLRHALATELLRRGASLQDIGQVLRHRDLATTAAYAKVDRVALRELAAPWPGAT